jgi:hypothetical protein
MQAECLQIIFANNVSSHTGIEPPPWFLVYMYSLSSLPNHLKVLNGKEIKDGQRKKKKKTTPGIQQR